MSESGEPKKDREERMARALNGDIEPGTEQEQREIDALRALQRRLDQDAIDEAEILGSLEETSLEDAKQMRQELEELRQPKPPRWRSLIAPVAIAAGLLLVLWGSGVFSDPWEPPGGTFNTDLQAPAIEFPRHSVPEFKEFRWRGSLPDKMSYRLRFWDMTGGKERELEPSVEVRANSWSSDDRAWPKMIKWLVEIVGPDGRVLVTSEPSLVTRDD